MEPKGRAHSNEEPEDLPEGPEPFEADSSRALKIALIYALVGGAWILLSDQIVVWLFSERHLLVSQTVKGLLYIALTTALIYWLARRSVHEARLEWMQRQLETSRRKSEEELKKGRELYRLLAENTLDVIWTMNLDLEFTFVNPAIEDLTGFTVEEYSGTPLSQHLTPERMKTMGEIFKQVLEEGSPEREILVETELLRKDGSAVPVELLGRVIFDSQGQPVSLQGTTRNISERRALAAQVRQAQKMESVGRLAGGIAHDFNNMLSVILGYAELALQGLQPSDPLYPKLEEIHRAAQHSAELTGQLLAFARKQTIQPRLLELNETVSGTHNMLRRLVGEDVEVVWSPSQQALLVNMDPAQINQILANLVVNSRDALKGSGTITLETDRIEVTEDHVSRHPYFMLGNYAVLSVSDDGQGIPEELMSKIFEPFFTTKPKGKGTGLGLAVIYGIVKQNGGFINVYSEPGAGTTVRIYLPMAKQEKVEGEEEPSNDISRGSETVLLVEDDAALLAMARQFLEKLGYLVLSADSGEGALQWAREYDRSIDLLVTDLVMPQLNGRELSEKILELRPDVKCLFMSGYTPDVTAQRGLLDEGCILLQKPFSIRELSRKIREALG